MNKEFEQISLKPGFMKHNGGLLFKTVSKDEYQFKTIIKVIIFKKKFLVIIFFIS